jgi:hypothetical protein
MHTARSCALAGLCVITSSNISFSQGVKVVPQEPSRIRGDEFEGVAEKHLNERLPQINTVPSQSKVHIFKSLFGAKAERTSSARAPTHDQESPVASWAPSDAPETFSVTDDDVPLNEVAAIADVASHQAQTVSRAAPNSTNLGHDARNVKVSRKGHKLNQFYELVAPPMHNSPSEPELSVGTDRQERPGVTVLPEELLSNQSQSQVQESANPAPMIIKPIPRQPLVSGDDLSKFVQVLRPTEFGGGTSLESRQSVALEEKITTDGETTGSHGVIRQVQDDPRNASGLSNQEEQLGRLSGDITPLSTTPEPHRFGIQSDVTHDAKIDRQDALANSQAPDLPLKLEAQAPTSQSEISPKSDLAITSKPGTPPAKNTRATPQSKRVDLIHELFQRDVVADSRPSSRSAEIPTSRQAESDDRSMARREEPLPLDTHPVRESAQSITIHLDRANESLIQSVASQPTRSVSQLTSDAGEWQAKPAEVIDKLPPRDDVAHRGRSLQPAELPISQSEPDEHQMAEPLPLSTELMLESDQDVVNQTDLVHESEAETTRSRSIAAPTIDYRLAVRESRVVQLQESVKSVTTSNAEVCEVVRLTPNQIVIIGKRSGTAQIEFRYDDKVASDTYVVAVQTAQLAHDEFDSRNQKLTRLVQDLYPHARIKLTWYGDQLILTGKVARRRDAIEIVSMVRQHRLVPVVDRLEVED